MLENFRLRVFRAVAAQSSFRRAAEVLYISQPAVTQHIKALEEELGTRVFDRGTSATRLTTGGSVRLTAAGSVLLRHAEAAELSMQRALEEIAALQGEVRGSLQVAASTTIAQYILPGILAEFAARHPGVHLRLLSANTERVVHAVADDLAPIGLIEGPAHRPDLLVEHWLNDELVLVVPAGHEWAGEQIPLTALSNARLLIREQGSGSRAVLEAALEKAGTPLGSLPVSMELSSTESLLACIEAGLGVGFASRFALRRQKALGTLTTVQVQGLRVRRELSLVSRRGPRNPGVAAAFSAHLVSFAQTVESERSLR